MKLAIDPSKTSSVVATESVTPGFPAIRETKSKLAGAILAGAVALALPGFQARADLADLFIPGTDITAYSTDFDDGVGWTGANTTYGASQNGEIVMQPLVAGDNNAVNIFRVIDTTLNIADGPLNIYYRVQVQQANGGANNRFQVSLSGVNGVNGNNGLFSFTIGPSSLFWTQYGWGVSDSETHPFQSATTVYVPSVDPPTAWVNYRLTLTQNPDTTFNISAYRDVNSDGNYVIWGTDLDIVASATGTNAVVEDGGGNFTTLAIFQRNNSAGDGVLNADWFDAIAVTQTVVPEPSTCMMIVGGLSMLMCVRRLSRNGRQTA